MKFISKVFNFLGSIYFAITLISLLALMVTAGTFIESLTDSHNYAALFTYHSPAFLFLLYCTFINVLFSALKRWPFRWKHIPFLVTHLGLLMVIGGVIVKNIYGVQGSMAIVEGAGSDQILVADSYAIQIEKKEQDEIHRMEYDLKSKNDTFPGFSIQVLNESPHSMTTMQTWIKGDFGYIAGLDPFPVYQHPSFDQEIPVSSKLRLYPNSEEVWDIYAVSTDNPRQVLQKIYTQDPNFQNSESTLFFDCMFTENGRIESPTLSIQNTATKRSICASSMLTTQHLPIEIKLTPKLIFIQNEDEDVLFVAIDRYGHLHSEYFSSEDIRSMIVYDNGFGGYFSHAKIPYPEYPYGSSEIYASKLHLLNLALRNAIVNSDPLTPPLQNFYSASLLATSDFAESLIHFLEIQDSNSFANLPQHVENTVRQFNWSNLSTKDLKGSYWSCFLLNNIENQLSEGKTLESVLRLHGLPQDKENLPKYVFSITELLPDAPNPTNLPSHILTGMLSAYMKAYGVELANLLPDIQSEKECKQCLEDYTKAQILVSKIHEIFPAVEHLPLKQKIDVLNKLPLTSDASAKISELGITNIEKEFPITSLNTYKKFNKITNDITLETAISPKIVPLPPTTKLETNIPTITVRVANSSMKQLITLAYDRFATGLSRPILHGEYRIRYQPKAIKIPYRVRLHDARQLNYPNSQQPYSYESDLIITDKGSGVSEEVTVSMNEVYESGNGYRFYLSNITPPDQTSVQRIQLVVNYDPVKYILTYPGGVLVALGIVLLFWMRPYRNNIRRKF